MICPECGGKVRCIASAQDGTMRRRRYRCLACEYRFNTVEGVQLPVPRRSACETCLLLQDARALCQTCKLAQAAEQFRRKH